MVPVIAKSAGPFIESKTSILWTKRLPNVPTISETGFIPFRTAVPYVGTNYSNFK